MSVGQNGWVCGMLQQLHSAAQSYTACLLYINDVSTFLFSPVLFSQQWRGCSGGLEAGCRLSRG